MKLTVLATAAAAALALVGASTADAGPRYYGGFAGGGGHSSGHGYVAPNYGYSHNHCAPVYKIRTVEVNRYRQCRTAYDHCGHPYTYHVTVVTYCDQYSNGSTRTWTRVYS
ncbi:MAG: hypothetical protein KDN18_21885 [Verrucomicrobiae bacterium]|nr:hypothetical protein [Verrucomicrobiae bacterium]